MLQVPSDSIFVWSNGQLTPPLSPRLHNACWRICGQQPCRGCWFGPCQKKFFAKRFFLTISGSAFQASVGSTFWEVWGPLQGTGGSHWFGWLCVSDLRWEVGKAMVMLVWNLNLDSVMRNVILTACRRLFSEPLIQFDILRLTYCIGPENRNEHEKLLYLRSSVSIANSSTAICTLQAWWDLLWCSDLCLLFPPIITLGMKCILKIHQLLTEYLRILS